MSEWIKCSERMPTFRQEVLAVDEYGDVGIGYFYEGYQGKLCFADLGDSLCMPTHWQPMPEPPKDVEP